MEDSTAFKELIDKLNQNSDRQNIAMENQLSLLELQEDIFTNFLAGLEKIMPGSSPVDYHEKNSDVINREKSRLEHRELKFGADPSTAAPSNELEYIGNLLALSNGLFLFDSNEDSDYQQAHLKMLEEQKSVLEAIEKNTSAVIPSAEDKREAEINRQAMLEALQNAGGGQKPQTTEPPPPPEPDTKRKTNWLGNWLDDILGIGGAAGIGAILKRGGFVALAGAAIGMLIKDVFDIGIAWFKGEEAQAKDIGGAIGSVVGAGVGFMVAGPWGAAIGSMLGNWLGGIIGKLTEDKDSIVYKGLQGTKNWFGYDEDQTADDLRAEADELRQQITDAKSQLNSGEISDDEFKQIESDLNREIENKTELANVYDERAAKSAEIDAKKEELREFDQQSVGRQLAGDEYRAQYEARKKLVAELNELRGERSDVIDRQKEVEKSQNRLTDEIVSNKLGVPAYGQGGGANSALFDYIGTLESPGTTTTTAAMQAAQEQLNANSSTAAPIIIDNSTHNTDNSQTNTTGSGYFKKLVNPLDIAAQSNRPFQMVP